MKKFGEFLTEAVLPPDSGKIATHIAKTYGTGFKRNLSTKGANFKTHTVPIAPENIDKMHHDLTKQGWKYSSEKNNRGDEAHTYIHPTDKHTTIVQVNHHPDSINSHLSNHIVTMSRHVQKTSGNNYD